MVQVQNKVWTSLDETQATASFRLKSLDMATVVG